MATGQHILEFFKKFNLFTRERTPSEIADITLKKRSTPERALEHLLQNKKQTPSTLEAGCLLWSKIARNNYNQYVPLLHTLLQHFPAPARADALYLATNHDTTRLASLLIGLAPFRLEGLAAIASVIKAQWDQEQRNDAIALAFYQTVTTYGLSYTEAVTSQVRAFMTHAQYEQAENVILQLLSTQPVPSADIFWRFVLLAQHLSRPPEQQLQRLTFFLQHYSTDSHVGQAWSLLGDLYGNKLMDYQNGRNQYAPLLHTLLQHFPASARADALHLVANHDTTRLTSLLIGLAPFQLEGLTTLASVIKAQWDQEQRNDAIVLAFYQVVTTYGLSYPEAVASQVRVFMAHAQYEQAESIILQLLSTQPVPSADIFWRFVLLAQHLSRPPEQQLQRLTFFLQHYPADARVGQAWRYLGDLYGNELMDYQNACSQFAPHLHMLLQHLPVSDRADALRLVADHDYARLASLLIGLAPFRLEGLTTLVSVIKAQWDQEQRNDAIALAFYRTVTTYGLSYTEAVTSQVRAFMAHAQYEQAESIILQLLSTQPVPSADIYWTFVLLAQHLSRPLEQQLQRLTFFLQHYSTDSHVGEAWSLLGDLYGNELMDYKNERSQYAPLLHTLLQHFPVPARADALRLVASHNNPRLASLLIALARFHLDGLTTLASDIKAQWDQEQRNDAIALAFYQVVTTYGLSYPEAVSSQVRVFMAHAHYEQAEKAILQLLSTQPVPSADIYWTFILLAQHLSRSPEQQLQRLTFFLQHYSADSHVGEAWRHLGDLYGNELMDYDKALHAYRQARDHGISIPQLRGYLLGNWDVIPALRLHPDYAFPPIVVIDLEADPFPGAARGSRVFEVAAVRYKGQTYLNAYQTYIKRPFVPAKWSKDVAQVKLSTAPTVEAVARNLQQFIGNAIVVGHNIHAFDLLELAGMGVTLPKARSLDTLVLARLLHPDSLHHHLALLCSYYHVPCDQKSLHTALPDAHACAQLLYAMGKSLVQREPAFLQGIRALVVPNSAFDLAILRPHRLSADPTLSWHLHPAPVQPRVLTPLRENEASPAIQDALKHSTDQFIEHTDFDAKYTQVLPNGKPTLVTVSSHTRIAHILAHHPSPQHIYVLPHPDTLLCPERLRQIIAASTTTHEQKLHLFGLYQASHNHDAATLYPLRLPAEALDDPELVVIRQCLLEACCDSDPEHIHACAAHQAQTSAIQTHQLLLSTHQNLFRQPSAPSAHTIVIDDTAQLQMHLAEYSAITLTKEEIHRSLTSTQGESIFSLLDTLLHECGNTYLPTPGYRERLPFASFVAYCNQSAKTPFDSLCTQLKQISAQGERLARQLEDFSEQATHRPPSPHHLHVFWIDLWFEESAHGPRLQQWNICGVSQILQEMFKRICWDPYSRHLLAGAALSTGGNTTRFLQRTLGLPHSLPFRRDPRSRKHIVLPEPAIIPPASFLQRRKWISQIGIFLAARIQESERAILVSLNNITAQTILLEAFHHSGLTAGRQLLATQLHWPTTKINERLNDPERRSLTFASPRARQTVLDGAVDVEISGPLRFLNTRDPLVIASMRHFTHLFPGESPFTGYLLPQALLEYKSRLTSNAHTYILCDGSLLTKGYRDELLHMLGEDATIEIMAAGARKSIPESFSSALDAALTRHGFTDQVAISDAELHLILRSIWETDSFRKFPPVDTTQPAVTQKEVVRAALKQKDQLVIAATGGGKSLCFQLPAIVLAEEAIPKVTLVFSPLIALMSNQVEQLNSKGIFTAIMLNSTLSVEQRQEHLEGLKKGLYSIVYLAPEQIYSKKLRDVLQHREIGLIAIDEAHCISQWGHNFRTDYFMLKKWIDRTLCLGQKRTFPILALTATARKGYKDHTHTKQSDQASTVEDIIGKLDLHVSDNDIVISSPIRTELAFHFEYITPSHHCPKCQHTYEYHLEVGPCPRCGHRPFAQKQELQQVVTDLKQKRLLALLSPDPKHKKQSLPDLSSRWIQPLGQRQRGLIYCAYRRTTEEVARFLQQKIPHLRICAYHAGMETMKREEILRRFISDEEEGYDIIVSTNAFGMGIDVRRLGFVIHFDTPATPEAYYQEAGRAGRDSLFKDGKEQAQCILLFHPFDLEKQRYLSSKNMFSDYEVEDVYAAVCDIYERNKERRVVELPLSQTSTKETYVLLASPQEIATRAGVEEEQVDTLLYYLEAQTTDKYTHQPVLERGEHINNAWRLKWEQDAHIQINALPTTSLSHRLLTAFQTIPEYQLQQERFTTIAARELAESLHMTLKGVEAELLNLARRHIIAYDGHGQFQFQFPVEQVYNKLVALEKDLKNLFGRINTLTKERFSKNNVVTQNIRGLISQYGSQAITYEQFTKFLFLHSLDTSEPDRLLEQFTRYTRGGQPDMYQLRLWVERSPDIQVFATIETIFKKLRQAINVLTTHIDDTVSYNDWHAIDLFATELNYGYQERRTFHHRLLLLETLGLLHYISDPAMGQAMQITLLQPPVPRENLDINLQSLRLQEKHAKRKRHLMESYATNPDKEYYAKQFAQYFLGEHPLLAQNQHAFRSDLTSAQHTIARLTTGIHLIEGPAGCGKTTTLAEHIKHLVNQGTPIDHIMVTTHYRAAEGHIANALKELESEGEVAISTTINAFGQKIFQQYRHLLKKPDGSLYYPGSQELQLLKDQGDSSDKELFYINQALQQATRTDFADLINTQRWQWPATVDIPQFQSYYHSNAAEEERFQAAIYRLRQFGIFPTPLPTREQLEEAIGEQTGLYSLAEFYAIYVLFLEIMASKSTYAFDDQVVFALAILRTQPDILREYQRYFEHIIIDELQDFTPAKIALLQLLCERHTNIMAFGDIYQEVGFESNKAKNKVRVGAADVFSKLAAQDHCGKHQLLHNFRSTQEILNMCSYLRRRIQKRAPSLQSATQKHGPLPTYVCAATENIHTMLDITLEQISQLSPPEKESVALIFGNKRLFQEAQNVLRKRNIAFSLMDGQKEYYQLHHVKNLLLYFQLIEDPRRDEEMERLLRYNIVPYFDKSLIATLKQQASKAGISLFDVLTSPTHLQQAKVSKEQQERLHSHLDIIRQRKLTDQVRLLEENLLTLSDGPLTLLETQKKKMEEIQAMFAEFRTYSIGEALTETRRHILYLEAHKDRSDLVLATVENAKSQEFESVFLLGIGSTYDKRLYVSASRAKQRLFFVGDKETFRNHGALSNAPKDLYMEIGSILAEVDEVIF